MRQHLPGALHRPSCWNSSRTRVSTTSGGNCLSNLQIIPDLAKGQAAGKGVKQNPGELATCRTSSTEARDPNLEFPTCPSVTRGLRRHFTSVTTQQQEVVSRAGDPPPYYFRLFLLRRYDGIFERFRQTELYHSLGGNLDRITCLRVATHASLATSLDRFPQTGDHKLAAALTLLRRKSHQFFQQTGNGLLLDTRLFRQVCNHLGFRQHCCCSSPQARFVGLCTSSLP